MTAAEDRVRPAAPEPADGPPSPALPRLLAAEAIGTAILLAAIVGSGIMASTRSPDDPGVQLLAVAVATGLVLAATIMAIGPLSGAHLNPVVTLAVALDRRASDPPGPGPVAGWGYVAAQAVGGIAGVVVANLMFGEAAVSLSATGRTGGGQWLSEVVATAGLVLIILLMVRDGRDAVVIGPAVGAYIAGAHWFTASTSFANPAVTLARSLSDTFAGIAPPDVLPFVAAQLLGAVLAVGAARVLRPAPRRG